MEQRQSVLEVCGSTAEKTISKNDRLEVLENFVNYPTLYLSYVDKTRIISQFLNNLHSLSSSQMNTLLLFSMKASQEQVNE